ncbi:ABC transporter permease [Arthrobacter psychrochitiniphilus]|uniref:ABC transporter permease n=1 Tax=Arthrobacter psychrochitiniphilus TaxID=291045 RepID=A0A2V3DS20_9MICC|nr:ABC transporter permease [Arthrobacter psychrochitiniphilus]
MACVNASTLLVLGPNAWFLLAVMLLLAAVVWRWALGRSPFQLVTAGARALAQLSAVALIIAWLSQHTALSFSFVAFMFVMAVWTSGHRVAPSGRWWMAAIPLAAAVAPMAALMFAFGVLPFNALAIIAVLGQQIGGAMSAVTLSGRRIRDELHLRHGETEAAVALGFRWPTARFMVGLPVAGEAVLPAVDQTRTAGLVTLPGAFVGMILGGAAPLDAGMIQLLVLISLLFVNSTAAAMTLWLSTLAAWDRPRSVAV